MQRKKEKKKERKKERKEVDDQWDRKGGTIWTQKGLTEHSVILVVDTKGRSFYQLRDGEYSVVPWCTERKKRIYIYIYVCMEGEYDMVRVISTNRVDGTIAYQWLHLVEWFCGRTLVVFRGKRKYSNRARARERACTRSLTQIRTDVHASCNLALIFRVCAITRDPFPSGRWSN